MARCTFILLLFLIVSCKEASPVLVPLEESEEIAPNPEETTHETETTEEFLENLDFECGDSNTEFTIIGYWNFITCEVELCIDTENCYIINCVGNENDSNFAYSFGTDGTFTFITNNPDYSYCQDPMQIHFENHGTFTADSQMVEEGNGELNTMSAIFSQQVANYIDNSLGIHFAYSAY